MKEDIRQRLTEQHGLLLLDEQQQTFLTTLNQNGGWMMAEDVLEVTGFSSFTFSRVRKSLVDKGMIDTFMCVSFLTEQGKVYCNPKP